MNLERTSILACLAVATMLAATIVGCNNNGANPGIRKIPVTASASPAAR